MKNKISIIKKGKNNIFNYLDEGYIFYIISMIIGVFIVTFQVIEIRKNTMGETNIRLIIYDLIIDIGLILINTYSFINKKEVIKSRNDVRNLKIENQNLIEVNDKVRCFKHDFNNIIQAIDGYITLSDMNSLQNYFNSLIKECIYVNNIEHLNEKIKTNPAIFSILCSKYKIAEKRNIKMNVEILTDLDKIEQKAYVVSRMLGILLDNALEASGECDEKIVNVKFIKQEEKYRDVIIVENTYNNKEIDTSRIFEKEYTTKKEKGNSGLGLWKIKEILSKDTSLDLFTTKDDKMFKQQLEIYS